MSDRIETAQGRVIACRQQSGAGPQVVFLHGFRSDMTGTKADALSGWAHGHGHGFIRFDLSGHGESGGSVDDFGISDWLEDATAVLDQLARGPVVLVGSSLGGWLALLLARARPDRVAGLVTVAAAPDFTARLEAAMTPAEHRRLASEGRISHPSTYGPEPDVFSQRLFEQGRKNLIFDRPLALPMPVRLFQGTADDDVPMADALRLLDHAQGGDIRLTLVKDADHRFSTSDCLALIETAVDEVLARQGGGAR